jgi:hypothetical protein
MSIYAIHPAKGNWQTKEGARFLSLTACKKNSKYVQEETF